MKTNPVALSGAGTNRLWLAALFQLSCMATVAQPPTITVQPTDRVATVGSYEIFSVTASGLPPLSYQWQKNGVAIPGATLSSYALDPVPSGDTSYSVTVSNGEGSVTSNTATLIVVEYEPYTLSTLAGQPNVGSADDTGSAARFHRPTGIAMAASGDVYVADTANHTIRKMTPAGVVSTVAGSAGRRGWADGTGSAARFNNPEGIAIDATGNLYVADDLNHTIRKITPDGVVTTLAGLPGSSGSADGIGTAARFNIPTGLIVDANGQIYVADWGNKTVRKISPMGDVTTLAGTAGVPGTADGNGGEARFGGPRDVAMDAAGNLYVTDLAACTIRKITPAATVTTLAGMPGSPGGVDGIGSAARFRGPTGLAADAAGNLYVSEGNGGHTIRKVTLDGMVTTLAGLAAIGGSADGTGSSARFSMPFDIAVDSAGQQLFVADRLNSTIRRITAESVVTTVAGIPPSIGSTDGTGGMARFNFPPDVAVDGHRNTYVADGPNHTIRKIDPSGLVTTLAGLAGSSGAIDGVGGDARFANPSGVASGATGIIYVADTDNHTIRMIISDGTVTTLAGSAGSAGSADGTGAAARFRAPLGIAVEPSGTVIVADTSNHTIRQISPENDVTTLAGSAGNAGYADGVGSAARFNGPCAVDVDAAGNVFVADRANGAIRKISPEGTVSTLVAGLGRLSGVAVDNAGNVYAVSNLCFIAKITPDGALSALAGSSNILGSSDGIGSGALITGTGGIEVDGVGNITLADSGNYAIRVGSLAKPESTAITALVRHSPTINASSIDGSMQVLLPENISLNGNIWISGDLLVPGSPTIRLNGHPTYAGTIDGDGAALPANHTITLNGNVALRHIVRCTDAIAFPTVIAPPAPSGTRDVSLISAGQSPGDFATLRNLTLNGTAGVVAVPPGTYGAFSANGSTGFALGVSDSTEPAVYHLQSLTLNGHASLRVVGPVILTVEASVTANASCGEAEHPGWLLLALHSGGLTLNGNAAFHGRVVAPSGAVRLNGNSELTGSVACDRLTLNGNSLLREPEH